MLTAIKGIDPRKGLLAYWIVSPLLIFCYLYLTALRTGSAFSELLLGPIFTLSFLTACFSLVQSWYLQQFQGKTLKYYLLLTLGSQLLALNFLGIVLVGWNLLRGVFLESREATAKSIVISGYGLALLALVVSALLVF